MAVQGAFAAHQKNLESLGATTIDVRIPSHLESIDALVIPGGESTTMSMQLERTELFDPIAERLGSGMPALGTCAGMIMLASKVEDGRPDQRCFGAIDISVARNGYGRQVDSFETDLMPDFSATGEAVELHAVFIRAPRVTGVGSNVEVLARVGDDPVLCRQERVLVTSFHPELTSDTRIHQAFLDSVKTT